MKANPKVWAAILSMVATPLFAASCESLASLAFPDAKITLTQVVSAGAFSPPGGGQRANPYQSLPEFCRVAATLTPGSDSAMAEAVKLGYATASTDTGHSTSGGAFVLGHPEKLVDFGWRSEHEMTVKAKAVIQAFYGSAPRLSYWNGCSTGGRQALKEAQQFPDDYDGIIAGAPANRTAISLWIAAAVLKDPASYIPPAKYK